MKSPLALATVLMISTVLLTACSTNNASNTSNPDKAWVQWASDTTYNILVPDLNNLLIYQPYTEPAYTDLILSAANQLKTDCSKSIQEGKNLTSSRSMKPLLNDF